MLIFNQFCHFHTKIIVFKWDNSNVIFLDPFILLSKKERRIFFSLSEKRKTEFLGVRYALRYMGINKNIFYNKKRKPFLFPRERFNISFSHSFEKIAIAISYYHIGIDIEKLRKDKKIIKIKERFLREDESFFVDRKNEIDYLHIIWGIKESLYKLEGGLSSSFIDNYKVSPFVLTKEDSCRIISCWIIKKNYSKRFSAFYRKIDDHYLVYIIDKEDN
ncbi:4'-phosphopantetheinyl transferase family protein [Blattabacterium cuenoti]|uniref:4'-phosphopantetheinyl transferase family protein n=1 Tax=Blattabacterium cuenoti TaxID=1653831 RepID=UPI00163CDE47|nr:4'-phosphopantetheinyl transferase superfamily protein [Blattabacterium cuenoti]